MTHEGTVSLRLSHLIAWNSYFTLKMPLIFFYDIRWCIRISGGKGWLAKIMPIQGEVVNNHHMGQWNSLGLVTTKLVFISKRKRRWNSCQPPKLSLERAASQKQPHREREGINTLEADTRHFEVFPEVILLTSPIYWKWILTEEKPEEENYFTTLKAISFWCGMGLSIQI